MKKVFLSLLTAGIVLSTTPKAMAMVMPPFSSCLNPQGSVQASYSDGVHGIVGDQRTFSGKDTVYSVDGNNFLQCFCPVSGNGVQTKWLKTSTLSQTDITLLQSQGWIIIPNGADWGLESGQYLAKNDSFVCGGNNAIQGEVLGLANTGDMQAIVSLFSFGLMALISGVLLKKVQS